MLYITPTLYIIFGRIMVTTKLLLALRLETRATFFTLSIHMIIINGGWIRHRRACGLYGVSWNETSLQLLNTFYRRSKNMRAKRKINISTAAPLVMNGIRNNNKNIQLWRNLKCSCDARMGLFQANRIQFELIWRDMKRWNYQPISDEMNPN